jgi:DNA-binding PadR family transcriptional regulator
VSLRYAVLAALLEGPASGYDLAKRFDRSVANFWHATRQQIYAELARLDNVGLVESELRRQRSRPDKRLYYVTARGHAELDAWIGQAPRPTSIKDELLVQVQAADRAHAPALLKALAVWRGARAARLEQYRRAVEQMLGGRTEADYLTSVERPGGYLTLQRGIAFERENLAWADYLERVLGARPRHRAR